MMMFVEVVLLWLVCFFQRLPLFTSSYGQKCLWKELFLLLFSAEGTIQRHSPMKYALGEIDMHTLHTLVPDTKSLFLFSYYS